MGGMSSCDVASFKDFFIDFSEKYDVYARIALPNFEVFENFIEGIDSGSVRGFLSGFENDDASFAFSNSRERGG